MLFLGLIIYLGILGKFFDQAQWVDSILSILNVVTILEGE